MNPSSILRPKPDVRLDYQSDSQRHKPGAVYVPSASRTKHSKHSSSTNRGYTSDSGHVSSSAAAAAASRAPAAYDASHAPPPSRQRTDPGAYYAYTQTASSSTSRPAHAHDAHTPSAARTQPSAASAPPYDTRAYTQRAPDRAPVSTPSHHPRTHESSKTSRPRAHDHTPPAAAAPPAPQTYMAVPVPPESHKSTHRSRKHAEESQRAAEANARTQAEAARAHAEASARARQEAEEAERAKEKAAAKVRQRELKARQEAELRRQQEIQAEVERRRRKEDKRAERRKAEAEAERLRAEQDRLKLQPSTSREVPQHPRVASAKDPRTARVKDSDESDNSARRYAASIKHTKHHRYASAPAVTVAPTVAGSSPGQQTQQIQVPAVASSQASYPRQPAGYPDNAPASSRETLRQYPATSAPSRPKHSKGASWSHNGSAPYPPGYAVVSGSDSEAAAKKSQRLKKPYRPSRTPADAPTTAAQTAPMPIAQSTSRGSSKGKMIGDMANWLFNRSDSKHDKKAEKDRARTPAADVRPTVVPVPTPSRTAPSPVVSIKAGEGPPDPSYARQRTDSNTGQPYPIDPRMVQGQTNHIPSHIEVLMQAHAASQTLTDTRQDYLHPSPSAVQPVASPPLAPQLSRPSGPVSQPSVYQAQSLLGSASHIATVAPSVSVPSPSPAPGPIPSSSGLYSHTIHGHATSYTTQAASVPAPSRSGYTPHEVPDRSQPTPAPTSRHKPSPPRETIPASSLYTMPDATGRYPAAADMLQTASSSNRQIDSKLTSSFPVNEDSPGRSSHRQHGKRPSNGSLRPQTRDEQRAAATQQHYAYTNAADTRPSRTTKTPSPGQHNSNVPPSSTPPKSVSQQVPSPHVPPPAPSASYAYDPSRPHAPISQPSTYPDTAVYPPPASRVDVAYSHAYATPHPTVGSSSPYNPSARAGSNNPSRYQGFSIPQAQAQPFAQPAATHMTTRSASNDTGSTTLVGHTPPQYVTAVPAVVSSEVRIADGVVPTPGSRYPLAVPVSAPSTSSGRHPGSRYHSDSSPPQPSPPSAQPITPVPSTKTSSSPAYPSNIAVPQPVRSYTTPEPRRTQTPAPIRIPARDFSSPGEDDELNTPSSLDPTPKDFYNNELHPVMTTQSLPEGKKKASFFGGLFRNRSSVRQGNEHILQPRPTDSRVRQPQSAKPSSSKTSLPYGTSDGTRKDPSSSRYEQAPSPNRAPEHTARVEPLAYPEGRREPPLYRLLSKRLRTTSGASAEAVDGTNAATSTVRASPASSLRSATPRLSPPYRDPVQATYDWRNRAEADEIGRSSVRRRRPGVTFDAYDDLPQAESHNLPYVKRAAARRQQIPQQLMEQT